MGLAKNSGKGKNGKVRRALLVIWVFLSLYLTYEFAAHAYAAKQVLEPYKAFYGNTIPADVVPAEYNEIVNDWNRIHLYLGPVWVILTYLVTPRGVFKKFKQRLNITSKQ